MATVQILGTAPNLYRFVPPGSGVEVWCANQRVAYNRHSQTAVDAATRWFNLHPLPWIQTISRREWGVLRRRDGRIPVYLQDAHPDVPGSVRFPREQIQKYFEGSRYFTLSAAWLIAFAIFEQKFDRIEMVGFEQAQIHRYAFERPCFFHWLKVARVEGIEVVLPPEIVVGPAGDPKAYDGPLYGYETHSLDPSVTYVLPRVGLHGLPAYRKKVTP